jgi:hypothetical protein
MGLTGVRPLKPARGRTGDHNTQEKTVSQLHNNRFSKFARTVLAGTAMTLTTLLSGSLTAQATPPTISCIGGLSTGTTCICRQPTEKIQTGPNSYRCVMGDLTTVAPVGPFGLRAQGHPHFVGGQGSMHQPFARPINQQPSLPAGRPMFR